MLNVSGNLVDGKGKLNVTITDYYDFKYENGYGDSLADTFITGYNNTAWKTPLPGHIGESIHSSDTPGTPAPGSVQTVPQSGGSPPPAASHP